MLKRARYIAYAIVTIVALAGLSCGGGSGNGEGIGDAGGEPPAEATDVELAVTPPTKVGTPSDETLQDLRAVESLVQDVIEALRQRSTDGLRAMLADSVRGTVTEAELEELASCVPEGETLELGGVVVDETTASAEITVATGAGDVMQIWKLARQPDNSWALSELPPCPFE